MRSRRFRPAVALLCAIAAPPACGTSDGHIVPVAQSAPEDTPTGPLGDRIQVTARVPIASLDSPVDIVRDTFGFVHIYARTPRDAFRAQGWMMARDRAPQLEVLRRTAQGRMAELFGDDPSFIDQDIAMRAIGLARVASANYAAMDPQDESRVVLDAFADGVSQYFAALRDGTEGTSDALGGLPRSAFWPWSGEDSLAIASLNAAAVSLPTVQELAFEQLLVGPAAAFPADSADPGLARRANILPDLLRFAPPDPATVLPPASVSAAAPVALGASPSQPSAFRPGEVASSAHALEAALARIGRFGHAGSNAWAVSSDRSATGHALLAGDPHFSLSSPAAPWFVHLDVSARDDAPDPADLHAAGAAMAGVPGIAYGFNSKLAWSAAASYFDTADLYRESVSADASAVRFVGADVPFTRTTETIAIKGREPLVFDALAVPHHGPVLPHIQAHAVVAPAALSQVVSVRWTGLQPSTDFAAGIALLRADGVDSARAAMKLAQAAGLAYVFADDNGSILYSAPASVPVRDPRALTWDPIRAQGLLPCRVLPGDGTAEWTGTLDEALLPTARDPLAGFVATANADPLGGSLDNDPSNDRSAAGAPVFLGCTFDPGFRLGRIQSLLSEPGKLATLDDLSAIQSDVRSPLGARIAPRLVQALRRALAENAKPGTFPHLSSIAKSARFGAASIDQLAQLFDDWSSMSDYRAAAGVKYADALPSSDEYDITASRATMLFNAWLVRFAQRALSDEASLLGLSPNLPEPVLVRSLLHLLESEPVLLSSYDAELRDSILWDDLATPEYETRDELMVSSLLDAIAWLEVLVGTNRDEWRWGRLHTVRLRTLMPSLGGLDIPPASDPVFAAGFPRPGDLFAVDAAPYDLTPSAIGVDGFRATEGPALRLVVEMAPSGPVAQAVLAGGQSADPTSTHFADDAEYWRHDRKHELAFQVDAVIAIAESRAVAWR